MAVVHEDERDREGVVLQGSHVVVESVETGALPGHHGVDEYVPEDVEALLDVATSLDPFPPSSSSVNWWNNFSGTPVGPQRERGDIRESGMLVPHRTSR